MWPSSLTPREPRSAATFSMGILRWSTDLRSECALEESWSYGTPKSVDHCGFAPDSHAQGYESKLHPDVIAWCPSVFLWIPLFLAQGTWWPARRMPRWSHRCRCPPPSAQPGRSSTAMVQLEGGMPFLRSIRTKKIVAGESGEVQNSEDTSNKFLWPIAS